MLNPQLIEGRPHWEHKFPEEVWPAFEDFRNFLAVVWMHLGLPEPTRAQYEMAHRLQYGADSVEWETLSALEKAALLNNPREDIIRCFRGAGKSYVTSAFAIWLLMRNPRDEKILVVSATAGKAKDFVNQTKGIIESLELCTWLVEGTRENGARRRDEADQFDVSGASLSQVHSVTARGITGQITGNRATTLVADDIEIERNSLTEEARARILNIVRSDFVPITKTEHGKGDIILLGTPQTEESIYNVLVKEMGFRCFTIPVRYPTKDKVKNYLMVREDTGETIDILAPYLKAEHAAGRLDHWAPTDTRFSMDELASIEAKGRATFALQYMLDTSLSDAERYPLRQRDLIVFSLNPLKAPLTIQWGRDGDGKNVIKDIPNVGFSGDGFLRPLFVDSEWAPYDSKVLFVDPAGRGKDETAWAVMASLGGTLFLLHVGGYAGDPAEAMVKIAQDAKRFDVNLIEVEPNYGQGMWVTAFQPILSEVWPGGCTVQESVWAKGQKEVRIIDTLEPVLTQHRLVIDESVVRYEASRKGEEYVFSLLYQLTHITRDRGSLKHDDRLDAVAGAVAHFMRAMAQDSKENRQAYIDQRMEEEIEDFYEMFERRPLGVRRGRRRADGSRTEVYQSRMRH